MARPLLLMALLAPVLAEIDMEFTRWPESVAAPLGDEVAFDCSVSVPAEERLAWRRRPDELTPWKYIDHTDETDAIHVSPHKANATKLTIRLRDRALAGEYQCVVWYGAIVLASVPAKLSIAELQLTDSSSKDSLITAPVDNPIVLHCPPVESNPPAVFSWWRLTPGGMKRQVSAPYGVLVIQNASVDDSGTYGCTATNEISGEVKDLPGRIHLKIQREAVPISSRFLEGPELVGQYRDGLLESRVRAGSVLRLWCGAVGSPAPRVTWARYGDRTTLPARVKLDPATQSLTVASLKPEDEGDYECSAGGVRRTWRVTALLAARWRGQASAARATEGGAARVRCPVPLGQPPPAVTWLLNAEPLLSGDNVSVQGPELYIEHVEKRHAGIVQCFVTNELGAAYEAALLTVVPVQITGQDLPNGSGNEKALHFPPQPRRRNRKNKGKNKVVMIPPSRPNVTRMSDESVMVSWRADADEGLPIQFFKVQYKDVTQRSSWKTANLDIPHYIRSYEVDGLTPEHEYKFRIAAVYSNQDNKLGNISSRFYLQRGERAGLKQPQAPSLTSVTPLSTTQLQVNWTWLSGGGVPADGFYVYYREVSDAGNYAKVTAAGGGVARSAILSHLAPDTPYDVKIQSYTPSAPSDFSDIKVARTMRNASAPAATERPAGGRAGAGDAPPPGLYTAAGAAGGAAALLAGLALVLLLCRRRATNTTEEKQPTPDECANTNGYLPGKMPITITANPLHAEGGDGGLEMPYLHNNNCGASVASDAATPTALRKHTPVATAPPPVDYV